MRARDLCSRKEHSLSGVTNRRYTLSIWVSHISQPITIPLRLEFLLPCPWLPWIYNRYIALHCNSLTVPLRWKVLLFLGHGWLNEYGYDFPRLASQYCPSTRLPTSGILEMLPLHTSKGIARPHLRSCYATWKDDIRSHRRRAAYQRIPSEHLPPIKLLLVLVVIYPTSVHTHSAP